jgi:uncharacterized protein (DUF934 family)
MATLIHGETIANDTWQPLEGGAARWVAVGEDGFVPDFPKDADLIAPLALLQARGTELLDRFGRTGVVLEPHEDPAAIASALEHLALVAVHFPKFGDGRGYSIARLLRERHGYRGEVRAVGDVLRDQLLFMKRSGFDSFSLRDDQDPDEAIAAFRELSEEYQASSTQPQPLFRRRQAQEAHAG